MNLSGWNPSGPTPAVPGPGPGSPATAWPDGPATAGWAPDAHPADARHVAAPADGAPDAGGRARRAPAVAEARGWAPDAPPGPGRAPYVPTPDDPTVDRYGDRVDPYFADPYLVDPDDEVDQGPDRGTRHRSPRPPDELDEAPRLPHVPGFDGLRALALIAVLLFHQGYDIARGGFLGLSSFFTLSGFLMTTLALAEWAQTGRLALGRFWERRARRIVPAYLAVLALVVVLQLVLAVGAGPDFRIDVLYALGWATNWQAVVSGEDVAGIFLDASPVQHLWAMAIEAQLLILLPLLVVGLMTLTKRHWRLTGAVFAVIAAVSFVGAQLTASADGNGGLAYYGTHTRAGEVLVGVALAYAVLSPAVRRLLETEVGVKTVRYGAVGALVVLAWLWHSTSLGDPDLFGGITALNAVLTGWVVLAVTTPGPTTTFLGTWPLRMLGRYSYTAYLVHWPIYLLIDAPRIDLPSTVLFALRLAATLAIAVGLHLVLEQPFRQRMRMPRPRLAAVLAGATVVVVAAAVVVPQQPPYGVELTVDDGNGPGDLDVVVPEGGETAASIALVGDGLAASIVPGFATWNDEHGDQRVHLDTHVAEGCPPGDPGPVRLVGETVGEATSCLGWQPRLPELLAATEADVTVVATGLGELGERKIDRAWRHLGDPLYDAWLAHELDRLADTLVEPGIPVLWATIPHVRMAGENGDWTRHDANDPARVDRYNELVRRVARGHDGIEVIDMTAWAQGLPRGGEFSEAHRQDGATFTEEGADAAAAWVAEEALDRLAG